MPGNSARFESALFGMTLHVTQTQRVVVVTSNDRRSSLLTAWITYTPRKLTWNPKVKVWKMMFLFKGLFFQVPYEFLMVFCGSLCFLRVASSTWLDPVRDQNLPVVFHRESAILFNWRVFPTPSPWRFFHGTHRYTFTYKNQAFMKVNIPIPWKLTVYSWKSVLDFQAQMVGFREGTHTFILWEKNNNLFRFIGQFFFVQDACSFLDTLEFLGDLSSDQLTLVVWSRGSRTTQLYRE